MMNLGQLMNGMESGAALGPLLALGLFAGDRRAEAETETETEGEAGVEGEAGDEGEAAVEVRRG